MNNIILYGYYGHGNLGDEAILQILLNEFKKVSGISLTIFTSKAKQVSLDYKIKTINSDLHIWKPLRIIKQLIAILKCDLFILGGGGLLKDYGSSSRNLKTWLFWLRIAQILKKKTALYGVGVENIRYPQSRSILKKSLKKTNIILLRDYSSKKLLENLGIINENIRVISDPTILFSVEKEICIKNLSEHPKIIINVRHWHDHGPYIKDPEKNKNFLKVISEVGDYLIDNYKAELNFIPMRTTAYDNDIKIANHIIVLMKNKSLVKIYPERPSVDEYLEILKNTDLVIGMRLHSIIIPSSIGIPVIGLEYMPKVKAFMESIGKVEYSHNINNISSETIINSINKLFNEYSQYSECVLNKVSKLRKITKSYLTLLVSFAKN